MIELSINGTSKQLQAAHTVAELITELELTGKRIAIECNGEIVPRSLFATTPLHNGDQLEIVVAVGGG
ncbi:sulfur carrier protein ThiS [Sulfuriferula thiophila]|uniref:sulfur carrier protein ThiS n=1 Tax=Sulfuriferula thiophila TaxID=1781211 RepID=UPI000F606FAA|nr:sulfur carrier protein ThiS [Sulfuriferula thiophila]